MHFPLIFTVAAGDSHPLVDLDMTVVIQLVLFVVTWFVARRFLFQPFLTLRARRAEGIDGARSEADRMSSEADAQVARYEENLAEARQKAQGQRREIHAEAAVQQREITEAARGEAQKSLADAHSRIASESEKARADLLPRADEIGREMAAQLLGRNLA